MPCGWGCGGKFGRRAMYQHFTECPRRPAPARDRGAERTGKEIAEALIKRAREMKQRDPMGPGKPHAV